MRDRSRATAGSVAAAIVVPFLLVLATGPAAAQVPTPTPTAPVRPSQLTVTTPYPSVEVDPGGEASFDLVVTGPVDERVDLAARDVPEGYTASFRGGGSTVTSVFTDADEAPGLELRVEVPDAATPGTYRLVVAATAGSGSAELPVDVTVSDTSGGSVSLTTDFDFLRGDSESSFSFDLQLANDTAQEITFALEGSGPEGWDVTVQPSGESQAATLTVAADDEEGVRVDVDPVRNAAAGVYPITVKATGSGQTAETELQVEITGSYALTMDAADGRLNTTATAGNVTSFAVVVINDGTAPLEAVELSGTAPRDWEVTFEPETIEAIAPGEQQTATARITPAGNAVAGDYAVNLRAETEQADDSIEVRTTVETSSIWGFVGVAIIIIVLVGLFMVFRTYGRR